MNKKLVITIITICALIMAGAIYFFNIGGDNQYCNYKLGWDKCDGKTIKISGTNPNAGNGVMQHPIMTIPPGIIDDDSKQYQNYLDTKIRGQIILLSDEKINCPDKMTVIGTLETNVGPCDTDSPGKNMYCGSSITVNQWKCN